MSHHFRAIAFTLAIALLSGCSYFKLPGVYKFPIQQGNIVTQDMVNQLKPGMTRSQVRFVLGTPLITDTFDQDRWDYFYSVKLPNGLTLREQVTVHFTGDKLSRISGDYLPSGATEGSLPTTEPEAKETTPAVPIPDEEKPGAVDESSTLDQDVI